MATVTVHTDPAVCGLPEITEKLLRAWARCVSLYPDAATTEELEHALDHFALIPNGAMDKAFADMVRAELAYRGAL